MVAALALLVLVNPVPAAAAAEECSGSFVNFWEGSRFPCDGGQPYEFYDPRGGDTTSLHLSGCSANPDIALMLWTDAGWQQWGGWRRFWCLNTDGGWQHWENTPDGIYYFAIADARSANDRLSVAYFHGAW